MEMECLPVWQTDPDLRWFGEQTELMYDVEARKGEIGYSEQMAIKFANVAMLLRLDPTILTPKQKRVLQVFLSDYFESNANEDDLEAGGLFGLNYRRLQRASMKLAGSLPFETTPAP